MPFERYSTNTRFETLAAYSRAVADEEFIYISGTVGTDSTTGEIPESVEAQLANIFEIIEAALGHFGAAFGHVVRTRVYISSPEVLTVVAGALRERFENHPPANTTLICQIPAPGAKVEVEVTARRPR